MIKHSKILSIILIFTLLAGCGVDTNNTDPQGGEIVTDESIESAYNKAENQLEPLKEIDVGITNVLMEAGYTLEHATSIHEILNIVGIQSIEIENMTGDPETGLNGVVCFPNGYTDRDRRFSFTTEDGELFYAGFLGEDLYDSSQGGFLKSYEDIHIPEKEISLETYEILRELAIEEVKSCLTHPDTADFGYFDWGVGRSDDKYMIIGKVTAQNSFAVSDELLFEVWFIQNDGSFKTEGVAFNGDRVK